MTGAKKTFFSDKAKQKAALLSSMTLKDLGLKEPIRRSDDITANPSDTLQSFLTTYLEHEEISERIESAKSRLDSALPEHKKLLQLSKDMSFDIAKAVSSPKYAEFKEKRVLQKLPEAFQTIAADTPGDFTKKIDAAQTLVRGGQMLVVRDNIENYLKVYRKYIPITNDAVPRIVERIDPKNYDLHYRLRIDPNGLDDMNVNHAEVISNLKNSLAVLDNLIANIKDLYGEINPKSRPRRPPPKSG